MQKLNKRNFYIAVIVALLLSAILLLLSLNYGKESFFLLLNTDAGSFADSFFKYFTYGGDGLLWIAVLLIVMFLLKRKDVIVLLISSFALSTIFTQVSKNFIYPTAPRPTKAIADASLIHIVQGVDVHTIGSFPSGHTATAFSIYLVFCLLLRKRWWLFIGVIYAMLVGYSRVYLAQHFPTDVAAGIIVAIVSIWLSLLLQEYWWRRKLV